MVRHIGEKLSCRACDAVVAAATPDHAIARGRAGAGLLAHIVVSKHDDHLPLYRQAEIYAREGVNLKTAMTSAGTAKFTIPATGSPGLHVIEILHGEFTFPYRNMQQNPESDRPHFVLHFTLTPGAPVLPPPATEQAQQSVHSLSSPGALSVKPPFVGVGQQVTVGGVGFVPGQHYSDIRRNGTEQQTRVDCEPYETLAAIFTGRTCGRLFASRGGTGPGQSVPRRQGYGLSDDTSCCSEV